MAPCGLVECDDDGRILRFNARLTSWLSGAGHDALAGVSLARIFTKPGQIFYQTHVTPLLKLQGFVNEIALNLRLAGGGFMPVFFSAKMEDVAGANEPRLIAALFPAEERQQYEKELNHQRHQARELASLLAVSPDAIVSVDPDLKIRSWNEAAEQMFAYGQAEVLDMDFSFLLAERCADDDATMPEDVDGWCGELREWQCRTSDGSAFPTEINMAPITNDAGKTSGAIAIIRDISGRLRTEQRLQLLMQEVNHRSINLLSVVRVVAKQTQQHTSPAAFLDTFLDRIDNLAANQNMLVRNKWKPVDLRDLVESQLSHLADNLRDRLEIEGPAVSVGSAAAQSLGMAIYELSTNAMKYGALSVDAGVVRIGWAITPAATDDEASRCSLIWRESGGPPVSEPTRKGFGTQITGVALGSNLRGSVTSRFAPEGLDWRLETTLPALQR